MYRIKCVHVILLKQVKAIVRVSAELKFKSSAAYLESFLDGVRVKCKRIKNQFQSDWTEQKYVAVNINNLAYYFFNNCAKNKSI